MNKLLPMRIALIQSRLLAREMQGTQVRAGLARSAAAAPHLDLAAWQDGHQGLNLGCFVAVWAHKVQAQPEAAAVLARLLAAVSCHVQGFSWTGPALNIGPKVPLKMLQRWGRAWVQGFCTCRRCLVCLCMLLQPAACGTHGSHSRTECAHKQRRTFCAA